MASVGLGRGTVKSLSLVPVWKFLHQPADFIEEPVLPSAAETYCLHGATYISWKTGVSGYRVDAHKCDRLHVVSMETRVLSKRGIQFVKRHAILVVNLWSRDWKMFVVLSPPMLAHPISGYSHGSKIAFGY